MIALQDGRKVEIEEYGDPQGRPALWFHGAFSSRLEGGFLDAAARERGVRLVALDRPGAGGSDPLLGRTITGYAMDVVEVLDALGLERAVVGGLSNGGMYAMAVASQAPLRVVRAVPVNPTTPVADAAARAALSRIARKAYDYLERNADKAGTQLESGTKPSRLKAYTARRHNPDAHLLDDPATASAWAASTAEVLRQPDSGYLASELALSTAPWGFDHRAVRVPVTFVSGEKDAGLRYAKVWARELPDAQLVVVPGGHMGMLAPSVARQVVEQLAGSA